MLLAAVGLGFGAGEQLTLRGLAVLRGSPWIGFHGLPGEQVELLLRIQPHAIIVDLDRLLASDRQPAGFTHHAAALAVTAARDHGRATVAVAGHPCFANPMTEVMKQLARRAGAGFEVVGAPSSLDTWAEQTATCLGPPGVIAIDARSLCEQLHVLDPHMTLIVWSSAYLDAELRARLAAVLVAAWGVHAWLLLHRAGSPPCPVPLGRSDWWSPLLTYDTTIVVPALPRTLPTQR